jgi:hypothetical protein
MSLKVMTWAWTVRLPPTSKIVLLAFADEANDSGFCFPSHQHVAKKCELGERTVRRMIKLLAAHNYLSIERRFNKNRSCTSNGYRLTIGDHPVKLTRQSAMGDHGKGVPVTRGGVTGDQVTTTEPCLYPKPPLHGPTRRGESDASRGDLWFPKSITKSQRQALRTRLARLRDEDAQEILDELSGRMNTTQVRNPISYCAALISRLERGEFTVELGLQVAAARRAENHRDKRVDEPPDDAMDAVNHQLRQLPETLSVPLKRMRAKYDSRRSERCRNDVESTTSPAPDAVD